MAMAYSSTSTPFTREGSQVQSLPRPPFFLGFPAHRQAPARSTEHERARRAGGKLGEPVHRAFSAYPLAP